MTKEQAIEEINKAFEPAFANYIITALTEGVTISDKALEQDNKEIFKQFKKKVFLESEDVLGNEMVDSYMITDYLAELMGVEND